jgi:hypothetical protein
MLARIARGHYDSTKGVRGYKSEASKRRHPSDTSLVSLFHCRRPDVQIWKSGVRRNARTPRRGGTGAAPAGRWWRTKNEESGWLLAPSVHCRGGHGRRPVLNTQALFIQMSLFPGLEQEQFASVLVDVNATGFALVQLLDLLRRRIHWR